MCCSQKPFITSIVVLLFQLLFDFLLAVCSALCWCNSGAEVKFNPVLQAYSIEDRGWIAWRPDLVNKQLCCCRHSVGVSHPPLHPSLTVIILSMCGGRDQWTMRLPPLLTFTAESSPMKTFGLQTESLMNLASPSQGPRKQQVETAVCVALPPHVDNWVICGQVLRREGTGVSKRSLTLPGATF